MPKSPAPSPSTSNSKPTDKAARDSVNHRIAQASLQATTREQERIGYELHDGLGQHLTGLAFYAKALETSLAAQKHSDSAAAARLVQIANQAVGMTRALARGLQPVGAEQGALTLALRQFCTDASQLYNVNCEASIDDVVLADQQVAQHLYRIAQEAVNNAVRHGQATHVRIDLLQLNDAVALHVLNNGTPLPENFTLNPKPAASTADAGIAKQPTTEPSDRIERTRGMGLVSMKLRVKQIRARLILRNVPKKHTTKAQRPQIQHMSTGFTVELKVTYKNLD